MLSRLVRSFAPALVLGMLSVSSYAGISVGVLIDLAPPPLPVYFQPPPPAADYIWTPGYWAYGPDGYYWIPGTWVLAPEPGLLWTPGYWAWAPSGYLWHSGYWGRHVGFYGGVNYGFGYGGVGYDGGYWRGGHVVYNRAVTNIRNVNVYDVYERPVFHNTSRVSFNGGHGGINARPDAAQRLMEHDRHFDPTPLQQRHFEMAAKDRNLRASVNHGRPGIAATERPASFSGRGVTGSRAGGEARYGAPDGTFRESHAHAVERSTSMTRDHAGSGGFRNDRPPEAQRQAMQSAAAAHNDALHRSAPEMQAGERPGHPMGLHEDARVVRSAQMQREAETRQMGQRQMQQRQLEQRQTYQRQSEQRQMRQSEQRQVPQPMRQQPEQRQVERQPFERRAAPIAGAPERAQGPRGNAGERRGGNESGRQQAGARRGPEQMQQAR